MNPQNLGNLSNLDLSNLDVSKLDTSKLGLDLSFSSIFAGFVFGVIGLYLLRAGRKNANFWHAIIGLAMMIYPYFVSGELLTWGVGAGLVVFAFLTRRK